MSFSDEMKTMCEEITASKMDRAKAIAEIRNPKHRKERLGGLNHLFSDVNNRVLKGAHIFIQHCHTDHEKMAEEMRKMLGEFMGGLEKETEKSLKEARSLIHHFHSDRGKMSEEMHTMLEEFASNMGKEIKMKMKEYHSDRKKMAHQMQEMLGQMKEMLEEFAQKNQKETQKFLKECRHEHEAMSEKQQGELSKFCAGLGKFCKELSTQVSQMRKENDQAQAALRADFHKAHQIFRQMARHKMPAPTPARAEEEPKGGKNQAAPKQKIMAALEENQNGMTSMELAYATGMKEEAMGRHLSQMIQGKRIRKKDEIYSLRGKKK